MAEEHQTLVENELPQETVEGLRPREHRSMSCNKGNLVTALSVFVGILIVGQAVTVYFVTQQQSKISELTDTTNRMKLEAMIKNLPGSPPDRKMPKIRMASISIPLVAEDPNNPRENLEEIAKTSNKIEDAVKYFLMRGNPLRKYPSLNGTFLDNLRYLRKSMEDEQWAVFDAWMQQWFLFYMVQNSPSGNTHDTTGEPLLTVCQIKASERVKLGAYKPQCDENGEFAPMQCWRGTGYCWCVYKNGTEVPETKTRAKPDCSEILDEMNGYYIPEFDIEK